MPRGMLRWHTRVQPSRKAGEADSATSRRCSDTRDYRHCVHTAPVRHAELVGMLPQQCRRATRMTCQRAGRWNGGEGREGAHQDRGGVKAVSGEGRCGEEGVVLQHEQCGGVLGFGEAAVNARLHRCHRRDPQRVQPRLQ